MAGPLFLGVQSPERINPNPTGADDGAVLLLPPLSGEVAAQPTEGFSSSPRLRGEVAAQPTEGFFRGHNRHPGPNPGPAYLAIRSRQSRR